VEVSFFEMLLVVFLAFIVLGPRDLVLYSRKIGQMIARLRTEMNNFKIMAEEQILKDDQGPKDG
jgi:Sec-independent protein translocase protein TatA